LLAVLAVLECALVALLLMVRRRELRLLQAIRRACQSSMEAAALSAVDQDWRSRQLDQIREMMESYRLEVTANGLSDIWSESMCDQARNNSRLDSRLSVP
jgi:hypothetical protein